MSADHRLLTRRRALTLAGAACAGLALPDVSAASVHHGRPVPRLEPLFDMTGTLASPQEVGATPSGQRRIFIATDGSFAGPLGRGSILPGGGDWLVQRADGSMALDVRITLRTDDDALIYMQYRGILEMSNEVVARRTRGEAVSPDEYYFRTTPVFETAAAKYAWLNRIVSVGVGEITTSGVAYSVYAVR